MFLLLWSLIEETEWLIFAFARVAFLKWELEEYENFIWAFFFYVEFVSITRKEFLEILSVKS